MAEKEGKFEEFVRNMPDNMVLGKAGPNGSDVVLSKETINGVPVYIKEVKVPCWEERCNGTERKDK